MLIPVFSNVSRTLVNGRPSKACCGLWISCFPCERVSLDKDVPRVSGPAIHLVVNDGVQAARCILQLGPRDSPGQPLEPGVCHVCVSACVPRPLPPTVTLVTTAFTWTTCTNFSDPNWKKNVWDSIFHFSLQHFYLCRCCYSSSSFFFCVFFFIMFHPFFV